MAFEAVEIAPRTWHLQSGANSGLIISEGQAILIDAGLDDDAGKKIKKTIESLKARLVALIITHAHADHFGGAAYLRRTLPPFAVYAPPVEAAIIANPILEGIMLSAGAMPFDALTGKFTLAQPCVVDQVIEPDTRLLSIAGIDLTVVRLHGHSPQQIGIQYDNVLFSADAFLPVATLSKYPIPFTVHIGQALATLNMLADLSRSGVTMAPGHGTHLSGTNAVQVIDANREVLHKVIDEVIAHVEQAPSSDSDAVQGVAMALGDPLASPVNYYLARTTIQAALVYGVEQGRLALVSNGNGHIRWQPVRNKL